MIFIWQLSIMGLLLLLLLWNSEVLLHRFVMTALIGLIYDLVILLYY